MLADIENLPEMLHFLDAQIVDDKGNMVLPELLAPPGRPPTKTEECLRGHTDALKLPTVSTGMAALAFTDDVAEHEAGELLEAIVRETDGQVRPEDFLSLETQQRLAAVPQSEAVQ